MAKAKKKGATPPVTKTAGLRIREVSPHKIYNLTMETYLADGEGRKILITRGETSISLNKTEALVLHAWLANAVETATQGASP